MRLVDRAEFVIAGVVVVCSVVLMAGCASTVEIDSEPRGATVEIDGQEIGETPTTYTDSATIFATREVVVELEGYETVRTTLERDGEFNNQALVLGIVGFAIWPLLPAWLWVLDYPNYVNYELSATEEAVMAVRGVKAPTYRIEGDGNSVTFVLEPEVEIDITGDYFRLPTAGKRH